jgi:hypothetical protein
MWISFGNVTPNALEPLLTRLLVAKFRLNLESPLIRCILTEVLDMPPSNNYILLIPVHT